MQVVLPHPKQQDKDVVLFLEDSQAAPDEEEAEQRAAVAALHRVQVGVQAGGCCTQGWAAHRGGCRCRWVQVGAALHWVQAGGWLGG